MRIIGMVLIAALFGCATPTTKTGQGVIDAPFAIAGGQVLMLPVTARGTESAENDKIKIEVAGFITGPSKTDAQARALTWVFDFTSKSSQPIEQVVIEEVAPSDPAVVVLRDDAPKLKGNLWSGSAAAINMNPQSLPWLYASATTIFVYRFTIKIQGEPLQVLYQPTSYSKLAKQMMTQ